MIEPRLASHILVGALRRQADAQGAFAAVLHKGDAISGSILLIRREKGRNPALFERLPSLSGGSQWSEIQTQTIDKEQFISTYLERRSTMDRDIWIVELDVPFAERFTDILAATS